MSCVFIVIWYCRVFTELSNINFQSTVVPQLDCYYKATDALTGICAMHLIIYDA